MSLSTYEQIHQIERQQAESAARKSPARSEENDNVWLEASNDTFQEKVRRRLGMVVYACNPGTREAEAAGP